MIKLVLISALVAVALAQFPKPCTVPLQFEARVSEFNHATSQETRYHLSYDAINKRVRFVEEVHARTPGRKFYERLYLHNVHEEYEVDLSSRRCHKTALTRPWRDYQIPANATFVTEGTVGVEGDGTTFTEWFDGSIPHDFWSMRVTNKNCVPLFEVFGRDRSGIGGDTTNQYWDTVIGIVDPNVFLPPHECE